MRKLSQINESIWRDTIVRNAEGRERKENSIEIRLQEFCERHEQVIANGIKWVRTMESFSITPEGLVDVHGSIAFYDDDLIDGKLPFKLGKVDGIFNCIRCYSLQTLEGSPLECKGYACSQCSRLKSFEGCTKIINGDFQCLHCFNIENLNGFPEEIDGNLLCYGCKKTVFDKEKIREICNVTKEIYN